MFRTTHTPQRPCRRVQGPRVAAMVLAVGTLLGGAALGAAPAGSAPADDLGLLDPTPDLTRLPDAAPGTAAAVGLAADLQLTVDAVRTEVRGAVGEVAAPSATTSAVVVADAPLGDEANATFGDEANATFGDEAGASELAPEHPATVIGDEAGAAVLGASTVVTDSASEAGVGTHAVAAVADARLDIPALTTLLGAVPLDATGAVISARADCPVGRAPSATVGETATIVVAGTSVVLDGGRAAAVTLRDAAGRDAGTLSLLLHPTTQTSQTAAAAGVELTFAVAFPDGSVTVDGRATIAQARCGSFPVDPGASSAAPGPVPAETGPPTDPGGEMTPPGDDTEGLAPTTPEVPPAPTPPAPPAENLPAPTAPGAAVPAEEPPASPRPEKGTSEPSTQGGLDGLRPTNRATFPEDGPTAGGTPVTVTGSGFVRGATTVAIGEVVVPANEVQVDSGGTSLSFEAPPQDAGEVPVVITTPQGSTQAPPFTYVEETAAVGPGDSAGLVPAGPDPFVPPTDGGTEVGTAEGSLPATGAEISHLAFLALAALAGGAALLASRRGLLVSAAHRR